MDVLKKLHLKDFHIKNNAKFASFAGWEMPISFGSSLEEHAGVREDLRVFDVSHMGQIEVSGQDALKFLNYMLTNDLRNCLVGGAQYTFMCDEKGGVIDDLIIYRLDKDKFLLCVNASNTERDFRHLLDKKSTSDCEVIDLSETLGLLAFQGPSSSSVLERTLGIQLSNVKKMTFIRPDLFGEKVLLSRTGYTGENGFEIYCSKKTLERLASICSENDIKWAGLAARDSLRLEAGYPLHGNELSASISPLQAKLGWAVGWNKNSFLGDKALRNEKQNGSSGYVEYYRAKGGRIPRKDSIIIDPFENEAGRVLSGGFSPSFARPIGTAWVKTENLENRKLDGWKVLLRGKEIPIIFGRLS